MARIYRYMAFVPLPFPVPGREHRVMTAISTRTRPPDLLGWGALAVVYVVWGSTYLAIRVGVHGLPPLTMAGLRYLTAGLVLYPIAIRTGGGQSRTADRPGRRQWLSAAVVGLLLLVVGNGGLSIGEQALESGFAAVLVATVPLWMVVFAWPIDRARPTGKAVGGLGIGLVGVIVLTGAGSGSPHLKETALVLGSSCAWGLGSVLAHRLALPRRALVAAALEMIVGGVLLLIAATVRGEYARVEWSQVPSSGWLALLYLIGPGSLLAFTAYGYALSRLPLATVSTYAYVNPLVAVVLGVVLLDEHLTADQAAGTALIVASVALTLHATRRPRSQGAPGAAEARSRAKQSVRDARAQPHRPPPCATPAGCSAGVGDT
jgi:drug/metabolite transporter (DMT)-like permease